MANVSSPWGLRPVMYRNGSPYNGAANVYFVPASDSTAIFIGDPVKGVTDSSDGKGVPVVTRASAGNTLLGVVIGVVSYDGTPRLAHDPVYRVASTACYLAVVDDPDVLFDAEEDDAGGAMSLGAGGRNVEWVTGSGNTTSGLSGVKLDSNTLNTTNTLSLRVHRPAKRDDNVPAGGALHWLVSINLHAMNAPLGV